MKQLLALDIVCGRLKKFVSCSEKLKVVDWAITTNIKY